MEKNRKQMSTFKSILKYAVIMIITAVLLIAMLLAVACIPREKIQASMERSAQYLQQKGSAFPAAIAGVNSSKADYYADAVLLNVAYNFDPEHPAESIAWARFYSEDELNWNGMVVDYLPRCVDMHLPANQQYLRYWHGSLAIVRPLLIWLDLSGIYRILGAALWLLMGCLIALLAREGFGKEVTAFLIAMIMISVWFVPMCLEYIWMFLLMSAASLITICLSRKQEYQRMPGIFLCIGMIASFLDFFTTETITLLIPLLFMYMIRHRQNSGPPDWILAVKCAVLWGMGYVVMWVSKWAFAAAILKENVMPYVRSSITLHLGLSDRLSMPELWLKSLRLNVRNLFVFDYGIIGAGLTLLAFFFFVFLPIVLGQITLRKQIQRKWVILYLMIGLVPYLRYIVLSSHSATHGWFTYRAQAASILALILAFYELVDITFTLKRKEKHR